MRAAARGVLWLDAGWERTELDRQLRAGPDHIAAQPWPATELKSGEPHHHENPHVKAWFMPPYQPYCWGRVK